MELDPSSLGGLIRLATIPSLGGCNPYQRTVSTFGRLWPDPDAFDLALLDAHLPMRDGPLIASEWEAEPEGELICRDEWEPKFCMTVCEDPAEAMGLYGGRFLVLFVLDRREGRVTLAAPDPNPPPQGEERTIEPERMPLKRLGWPTEWPSSPLRSQEARREEEDR